MATIRKNISEYQPSEELLQQIVSSAQSGNYDTARTLLTQSLRPRTKKEKIQSSAQWHELLLLLQMYASTQCATEVDVQFTDDKLVIPSEWTTTTENNTMTLTIPNQIYRLLQAYRYYRQHNYNKVIHLYQQLQDIVTGTPSDNGTNGTLEGISNNSSYKIKLAWEHLYGQSLNHLQNGTKALQVYRGVLDQTSTLSFQREEQTLQLYTNYVAVLLSYFAIPYCGATDSYHHDEFMTKIQQSVLSHWSLQKQDTTNEMISSLYTDLSYNVATYHLLTTSSTVKDRQEWLQVLFSYFNDKSISHSDSERFKDQFSLRWNAELFREYFWNLSMSKNNRMQGDTHSLFSEINETDGIAQLSSQQQCVYRMNDTMLMLQSPMSHYGNQSSSPELILQNLISEYLNVTVNNKSNMVLTNLQQHIIHYNTATYQYRCQQYTQCQQTCQQYFLSASSGKPNKKKKKSTVATTDGSSTTDSTIFEISAPAQYQTSDEKLFWECRATVLFAHCTVALVSELSPATDDTTSSSTAQTDDNAKIISSALETLNPFCVLPSKPEHSVDVHNHVVLYARLHQYALQSKLSNPNHGSENAALQMLESLPEAIRSKPMLQSTITKQKQSLAERSNVQQEPIDDKPTLSKLQTIVQSVERAESAQSDWNQCIVFADFAVSHQRYADATKLYEAVLDAGKVDTKTKIDLNSEYNTIMAKYVRALSFVRPDDAVAVWSNISNIVSVPDLIPIDTGTSLTSGSELEMKEIVFHNSMTGGTHQKLSVGVTITENDASDDTGTKSKKNHAAVLRQRAKKRELYLQQKSNINAGSTVLQQPPDPERWLPKYERSNYAKYRRHHKKGGSQPSQSKSAQGVVTVQDMAKLDVVAHQAATAAAAAAAADGNPMDASTIAALRSTAHLNVSNKGRGKKRR